jgi:hypothetical protein
LTDETEIDAKDRDRLKTLLAALDASDTTLKRDWIRGEASRCRTPSRQLSANAMSERPHSSAKRKHSRCIPDALVVRSCSTR